jgi:hypothetical protein
VAILDVIFGGVNGPGHQVHLDFDAYLIGKNQHGRKPVLVDRWWKKDEAKRLGAECVIFGWDVKCF